MTHHWPEETDIALGSLTVVDRGLLLLRGLL